MSVSQTVITALRRYFTPGEIARILKNLAPRSTPIMDLVYPEARRKQKTSSMIALSEIQEVAGAAPVVKKGTRSYSMDGEGSSSLLIEPEAFVISKFVKASELNNLVSMGLADNAEAFVQEMIESLRNSVRAGTEIMAAQSLAGGISYPMADESGTFKDYEVKYGDIDALAATDIAAASYGEIRKILEEIYVAQQDKGYAGDIRFLVGSNVYTRILDVVTALKTFPGQWTPNGLVLDGKYKISPMGVTYKAPGETAATAVVATDTIQAIDVAAEHTMFYCAIDDMEAGLAPMPFFAKIKETDDPSGVKIIGNSKPLPAPVLKAMTKQKLL